MKLLILWIFILGAFYSYGFCIKSGNFIIHPDGSYSTNMESSIIHPDGSHSVRVRGLLIHQREGSCTEQVDFVFGSEESFLEQDDVLFDDLYENPFTDWQRRNVIFREGLSGEQQESLRSWLHSNCVQRNGPLATESGEADSAVWEGPVRSFSDCGLWKSRANIPDEYVDLN